MGTKIFMYCLMCLTMVAKAVADDHAGPTNFDMKPGIRSSMSPCLENTLIVSSDCKEHSLMIERPVDCTEKVHYQVLNNGKGMPNCGNNGSNNNGANNNTFVLPSDDVLGDECSRKCTAKYEDKNCRSLNVTATYFSKTGNKVDVNQEIKVFFNKELMVLSSLVSKHHIVDPAIVEDFHLQLTCRVGEEGKVYKPYDPLKICCGLESGDETYQPTIRSLSFEDIKDWFAAIWHRGAPANPLGTALEWRKQGKYCLEGFFPVDIPMAVDRSDVKIKAKLTVEVTERSRRRTNDNSRRNNHLEKDTATPSTSRTLQVVKYIKISRVISNNNTDSSHIRVTHNNYTNSTHSHVGSASDSAEASGSVDETSTASGAATISNIDTNYTNSTSDGHGAPTPSAGHGATIATTAVATAFALLLF